MDNIATSSASLTIMKWKVLAEIFQSFGIGLGAILGGLGGLILFLDWKGKKNRTDYLRNLRAKYPRSLLNNDFKVVHTHERRGWWFILDNVLDNHLPLELAKLKLELFPGKSADQISSFTSKFLIYER